IAAAVDEHDLFATRPVAWIVRTPVGPVPTVVIAAVVRTAATVAARRRIQQQAEVRARLALDLGGDLCVRLGALRQGHAGDGGGDDRDACDRAAKATERETDRHCSTPSLTALLRTGDLGEHG